MKTVTFKAGETILSQDDDGDTAFLIVSGSVEVTIGTGKGARTVGILKTGEVFGEMSLIEPGPRTATVKALTDTECVVTSYEQFATSMRDNPEAALEFMKTLVRRLRHMNELMATVDPKKRSLRQIFHDWQRSTELLETGTRAAAEQQAMSGRYSRMI
jgi:CRP/FNR family cyclic AMP-dependent transcriptional regulator